MKIIYIYHSIAIIGGIERIFTDKMNYLADKYNQEVYLVTTCQGKHPLSYKISPKITHLDLSIRFHTVYQHSFLKRLWLTWEKNKELKLKLQKTVDDINPDIIIATNIIFKDVVCKLNCKAKIIIESHIAKYAYNYEKERNIVFKMHKKWEAHKFFKTIEKKSDLIISLTKADAKNWHANNVTVIPNIVDIHNKTYSQQNNKTAIFLGRFEYQKGLDRMLEAWKIVIEKRKDWTLKLVGEGSLEDDLRKKSKKIGIDNHVIFIPATKNVVPEYTESSIFLFTSRYEGFGLVLVEAMQCGLPCVSFDCPYGPSDIIDDGENGYLVENGNIEKFANRVLKLIENDELRKKMGAAAIEKSKQYLPEKIMPQWMELFKQLKNEN